MASPIGSEDRDVGELFENPHAFRFFQAVRLLEQAYPDRTPVGGFGEPNRETVRFGANPSLSFPASEIQSLQRNAEGRIEMAVNFIGLVGPLGVLPQHYTELITERLRSHDPTLLSFLNIFQHRITSLFHTAWKKHKFTIGYEADRNDPLTKVLFHLVGLGTADLQRRQAVLDETFLFYSGFFGMIPRSAIGLESVLADYFDCPVRVEQFVGTWRSLEEEDQCSFELEFSDSTRLGMGAVAGDEVWDQQSRARVRIGPVNASRYLDFLPNGQCFEQLKSLIRMYGDNNVEFEVQLVLEKQQVPACELGLDDLTGPQLGWFTWMKSKPEFDRDAADTVILLTENSHGH